MVWGLDFEFLYSNTVARFASHKLAFLRASIRAYKKSMDLFGMTDFTGKNILFSSPTPTSTIPTTYDLDTTLGVSNDLGNKANNGKDIGSGQDAGK